MWSDRSALADLDLGGRERVLDVGCGTGELTRVLAEEAGDDATVVGLDADPDLLRVAREGSDRAVVVGDATRLPFRDGTFDLVVCQALLVNLPDPLCAVREFARVSSDLVAAIEPDNDAVAVESTVDRESALAARLREAYLDGVETDVALGERTAALFREAGLSGISARRHYHRKRTTPPYDEGDLAGAARKAGAAALSDHETELRRSLSEAEYDDLRNRWRSMGREVVEQVREEEYRRVEVVPFDVTAGRV
jgi:SAM-dependent methyltransferase